MLYVTHLMHWLVKDCTSAASRQRKTLPFCGSDRIALHCSFSSTVNCTSDKRKEMHHDGGRGTLDAGQPRAVILNRLLVDTRATCHTLLRKVHHCFICCKDPA